MIKYRYFPFLGFKTFDQEDKEGYGLPLDRESSGLVFEWLSWAMILYGKVYSKDDDGN